MWLPGAVRRRGCGVRGYAAPTVPWGARELSIRMQHMMVAFVQAMVGTSWVVGWGACGPRSRSRKVIRPASY